VKEVNTGKNSRLNQETRRDEPRGYLWETKSATMEGMWVRGGQEDGEACRERGGCVNKVQFTEEGEE